MNASARLATRLLAEAEPVPEQTPEPEPGLAPQSPDTAPPNTEQHIKDWIVDQPLVTAGLAEPGYYQNLLSRLGGKSEKKLDYGTVMVLNTDGTISVRLHATDILTARPDGIVTVNTYGRPNPAHVHSRMRWGVERPGYGPSARSWRTPFTRSRLQEFLPCGWNIYSHGKSSLPSSTAMVGGKRGDQNWWWANSHSRSGYWNGPGQRIPFSDRDQIDTKTGDLIARAQPVPLSGRGSNPERTSGYGFNDRFYEAKKIAPAWTETGGVFGDFTAWPKVEYYAKCPACGHVHGSYKTMREAHMKRMCSLCDVQHVDRIKDAVAHVDDPGMDAKKILRIVGESNEGEVRDFIFNEPPHWVSLAKHELESQEGVDLDYTDTNVPDDDPETVDKFELEGGDRNYWVFKNSDIAEAHALEMVSSQLESEPDMFSQEWLIHYIDTDKLKEYLMPEDSYLEHEDVPRQIEKLIEDGLLQEDDFYTPTGKLRKITPKLEAFIYTALEEFKDLQNKDFDPLDYLQDIYGKQEWMKEAFKIAPLHGEQLAEAAQSAVDTDGWAHFVSHYDNSSIDLPGGAVAARVN